MHRIISVLLIVLLGCTAGSSAGTRGNSEILAAIHPRLTNLKLTPDDLHSLADRRVIVRPLATRNSREMAAFGAVVADATPEAFVESYRTMAAFHQNPSVMASGRFSSTPSLDDLKGLVIDDKELYALRKSLPRESEVKLSEQDIARFQAIVGSAPKLTPMLKARLQAGYKDLLVERARTYLAKGTAGLGSFADKKEAIKVHDAFTSLAREQVASAGHCDHLYSYLESYPGGVAPDSESFIYWAKQKFGTLKPVINLVHVLIHREGDRVFIASKQIYSNHYTEAGLSVAELTPFNDNRGQRRTLVLYWIRLQVDMLSGALSFMKRRMAQPRMHSALKESLNDVRLAMERPTPDRSSE